MQKSIPHLILGSGIVINNIILFSKWKKWGQRPFIFLFDEKETYMKKGRARTVVKGGVKTVVWKGPLPKPPSDVLYAKYDHIKKGLLLLVGDRHKTLIMDMEGEKDINGTVKFLKKMETQKGTTGMPGLCRRKVVIHFSPQLARRLRKYIEEEI